MKFMPVTLFKGIHYHHFAVKITSEERIKHLVVALNHNVFLSIY